MGEACRTLNYPIVSGNVSLYNETDGTGIHPTPAIGGVGLLKDVNKHMTKHFKGDGETILLIGETKGELGSSLYLREVEGREEGAPPPVSLEAEKRNGDFVRNLIQNEQVTACHDISDGGLLVALAEMAFKEHTGATVRFPEDVNNVSYAFGEDQARYIVSTSDASTIMSAAKEAGVEVTELGKTGGSLLLVEGLLSQSVSELHATNETWLQSYMAS